MTMTIAPTHSLRTRLIGFLLAAVVAAAVTQGIVTYRTALAEADQIFDYHMQQTALSLRPGLPVGRPDRPVIPSGGDENFDFVVEVWTVDGLKVFQSTTRDALPQRAVLGFSDVRSHGTTYRVFSIQTATQVIQVAQDLAVRREMAGKLAFRAVSPILLMVPLLMLAVWWVVSNSLSPVAKVRRELADRRADDLSPVGETGLPAEVRPLVDEMNLLFGRVRRAFDAQRNFVADAAHELRSPLAALKLQAQALQRATDTDTRSLAVIRLAAGIDRATRLVDQLLVLARQEARVGTGAKTEAVVLADIARQAVAEIAAAAGERNVDIGVVRADPVAIDGHADALRILLRNLLENATKYVPAGGRVDVAVRATAAGAELAVEDNGPGILAAERARVLDRFYRLAESEGSGSGLGLAIVKTIAELHRATLALDTSPGLGGLRVTVAFPAAKLAPA